MTRTDNWFHSTCPHDCPSTCALEVERVNAEQVGRVRGARDHPYTQSVICGKVSRYAERVHHPARLLTPLRRTGERGAGLDGFQPISWEDALDETAEALMKTAQRDGGESVWPYFYAGTMGLVQRDGIDRLRHVMGYSGQNSTICTALANAGWLAGVGVKRGIDGREISKCDLLVVWGGNPVNTQVNVMHHYATARRDRDAPLVVVDPYRTDTARRADHHLMLKPGTDGALACAVMHVLFEEEYADWSYLRRFTDSPDELRAHLATRDPAWAAEITGLGVDEIVAFARLYGGTQRSFLRLGYGFTRSRNGATNMHAVSCLPAITGAWQYEGGGALYSNDALSEVDMTLIRGLDARDPSIRSLDQSRIGDILCDDAAALGDGPRVSAMFIQNTNPMQVAPDSNRVFEGFSRRDLFVCVHEQFLTETAAMADIVLPATTFLEHDDIYEAGGHTFLQIAEPVIPPVGECRSNHEVLQGLAQRLGARHPGFEMTARELVDATLKASGYPPRREFQQGHWIDLALDPDEMHFRNGFGHPDGRFRFRPQWRDASGPREDMPDLPDHFDVIDSPTDAKPFRLVTAPARWFLNSTFTELDSSRRAQGSPCVKIHPADASQLGLGHGERATLGNDRGRVSVVTELFDGVQPGVVVVESIWPGNAFPEGRGINALTCAKPADPAGGAVFHDTAVWIEPVGSDPNG